LTGLQDINVTDVKETEKEIEVFTEIDVKEHICPCCGEKTAYIHDYRTQKITDIPYRGKIVTIAYRKRRYVCKHCGKRFYEQNGFVPRYHQMTNRLSAYIIDRLRGSRTYTDVSKEIGKVWFKNSEIITDKYHWIRQTNWSLDRIRKRIQKEFSKQYRIYFKHSRNLLFARFDSLSDEQKQQVLVMLSVSADLSTAHFLKEWLYKILEIKDKEKAIKEFKQWIEEAEESEIQEFKSTVTAYRNWFKEITNSFCQPITNGFTEGCNNKIKVLKRNAYGYRNFNRFRKRILFMYSDAA